MGDRTKKLIYWSIYAVFFIAALSISLFRIILINNTAVFLFGLIWVWNGVSVIIKINPYHAQEYERKYQYVSAVTMICMGVVWCAISLTSLSDQALPMAFVSIPFLIPALILFLRYNQHQC